MLIISMPPAPLTQALLAAWSMFTSGPVMYRPVHAQLRQVAHHDQEITLGMVGHFQRGAEDVHALLVGLGGVLVNADVALGLELFQSAFLVVTQPPRRRRSGR